MDIFALMSFLIWFSSEVALEKAAGFFLQLPNLFFPIIFLSSFLSMRRSSSSSSSINIKYQIAFYIPPEVANKATNCLIEIACVAMEWKLLISLLNYSSVVYTLLLYGR
ncbi:hypothetical protein Dimus_005550 [Dionaea muscipula]